MTESESGGDENCLSSQSLRASLRRLKSGDSEARREIIECTFDRMRSLASKMLGRFPAVRRWYDTDDLLQKAATRIWLALEEVHPEDERHFINLSALQIRRELLDFTRTLQGPLGLQRNHDSVQDSVEPTPELPESTLLAQWTEFHDKVDELPAEERECFHLLWYQGLSQHAVADLTGSSQKTVGRRWQRARRHLFDLLGGELPE